jgi:hypothetical protein
VPTTQRFSIRSIADGEGPRLFDLSFDADTPPPGQDRWSTGT